MKYWQRNLLIMWICQFLTMVGMSAIVPFLPLFVNELGVHNIDSAARWSGFIFSGPFFISLFMAPVWGNLGDKYGRKVMTVRAIFGLALAQFLISLVKSPEQLMLVRLLQGLLSGFLPAAMALIVSNTPKEKTSYALGVLTTSTAAGNVLGPFLGGVIADILGYRTVFTSVSILLFLVGILIIILVEERNKISSEDKKYSLKENWNFLFKNSYLLWLSILICLSALGLALIRPIFALYIQEFGIKSSIQASITGAIYGIVGIFTVISAAAWGKKAEKSGYRKNLIITVVLTGIMYAVHAVIFNIYLLIPVRAVLGYAYGGITPLLFALVSNKVAFERKGGILGVVTSFQILGNIIGPVLSGMISPVSGFRVPFVISGVFFLLMGFIVFRKIRT